MSLDLTSLRKAIDALQSAIAISKTFATEKRDPSEQNVIRAGVIQHFEFTYEICWKFMKRWLEQNGTMVDGATRKELFRLAAESRLIGSVEDWFGYTRSRNETVHTYDQAVAIDVYATAVHFSSAAKTFLKALESRND